MSRLGSGHHPDLKYWLHKIGRALDIVCWKCGMGRIQLNIQWGSTLESSTLQPNYPNPTRSHPTPSRPWSCGSSGRQDLTFHGFHNGQLNRRCSCLHNNNNQLHHNSSTTTTKISFPPSKHYLIIQPSPYTQQTKHNL